MPCRKACFGGVEGLVGVGNIHWVTRLERGKGIESSVSRFSGSVMEGRRGNENCDGIVRRLADEGLSLDGDISGVSVYRLMDAGGVQGILPRDGMAFASLGRGVVDVSVVPSDVDLLCTKDAA